MWLLLNGDGGNKNRTAGTESATQSPGWWKEPVELPPPCLCWGFQPAGGATLFLLLGFCRAAVTNGEDRRYQGLLALAGCA